MTSYLSPAHTAQRTATNSSVIIAAPRRGCTPATGQRNPLVEPSGRSNGAPARELDSPPLLCYTLPAFLAATVALREHSFVHSTAGQPTSHSPVDRAGGVLNAKDS